MDRKKVLELIWKDFSGDITDEELAVLRSWASSSVSNQLWYDQVRDPKYIKEYHEALLEGRSIKEDAWQEIKNRGKALETKVVKPSNWRGRAIRIAVAAAVTVAIGLGSLYEFGKTGDKLARDIAPGGNHATLTLGDGHILILDSAKNGLLARQGSTKVDKTDSGNVTYTAPATSSEIAWNTISVPKGGIFRITLPDGSKVVLNSASSLVFPTAFTGKERLVKLEGEGYFEVAHNPSLPFRVILDSNSGKTVTALGTTFDIMAYPDEPSISATLLSGLVEVSSAGNRAMLMPDQICTISQNGALQPESPDTAVRANAAWATSSMFYFNHADIRAIMRQIARWYSLEVEYGNGSLPPTTFSGLISRDKSLSVVMDVLKFYGFNLQYEIKGRKIIVQP